MAKENWYATVTMSHDIVGAYYPPGNDSDFNHFVFQPMIDDGTQANDVYTLIVYAVDVDGNVLGSYSLITSVPKKFKAGKTVNFANMKMGLDDLDSLYPEGGKSAITMTPTGFYDNGTYVYYVATTDGAEVAGGQAQINPSPPA